jgi:hypothetical protein
LLLFIYKLIKNDDEHISLSLKFYFFTTFKTHFELFPRVCVEYDKNKRIINKEVDSDDNVNSTVSIEVEYEENYNPEIDGYNYFEISIDWLWFSFIINV